MKKNFLLSLHTALLTWAALAVEIVASSVLYAILVVLGVSEETSILIAFTVLILLALLSLFLAPKQTMKMGRHSNKKKTLIEEEQQAPLTNISEALPHITLNDPQKPSHWSESISVWFGWVAHLWKVMFPNLQSTTYPRTRRMRVLRSLFRFCWSIPTVLIGYWLATSYFPLVFIHLGTLYSQGGLPALADPTKFAQALQLDLLLPLLVSPLGTTSLIGLFVCMALGTWSRWDREQEKKAQNERMTEKAQEHLLHQITQQGESQINVTAQMGQQLDRIQGEVQAFHEPLHELAGEVARIAQQIFLRLEVSAGQLRSFCEHQVQKALADVTGNAENFAPYFPDVYLPRHSITEAFQAWFSSDYPCFAVIGPSGIGKTSFMASAANTLTTDNFVLFYRAKHVSKGLQAAIVQDFAWEYGHEANFVHIIQGLDTAASELNNHCVILLDGLDEFHNDLLKAELMEIVPHLQGTRVRLCMSCTETDWERFVVEDGNTPTPLARSLFPSGTLVRSSNGGIWLEPFDNTEVEEAFAKYKAAFSLSGILAGATREQCKHPLWLRFLAATYKGGATELSSTLSNRQLFDMYWDRQLSDVKHRIATERLLSRVADLCIETGKEEIELSQLDSAEAPGVFTEEAYHDALRFGLIQAGKDAQGYDTVSFSYPVMRSYTYTIKSQKWPQLSPANLAQRMGAILKYIAGVKAVEFYLTTIDRGETEEGINGVLTEIALRDFGAFVRLTADLGLQSNLLDKATDEERSTALFRRLEQYVRTYGAILTTHFPSLWQKVDPYIDLRAQFPQQNRFGEVGIWVSNYAFQLRARTQEYPAPLIILPRELAGASIQGRISDILRRQIQGGGTIQLGFPQIEKNVPQKLAWERLRSQIARLFINRVLDESQAPALLAERCREDLLYQPSIWLQGCQEQSEMREYIHQLGFSKSSDLYATPITDILAKIDSLLRQFIERAGQSSTACQRWFDLEIKRLLRLTYALHLLRAKSDQISPPRFNLDELFLYSRQESLADYIPIVKGLLPDIINSYTALLHANFSHLADRFTFSKFAQQSMLVEVAHEQLGGLRHSDNLTITYALLPSTKLPEPQVVYAHDGSDSLATLPTTHKTLTGWGQRWGGHFGQTRITKMVGNMHIDEPEALIYVTRFPSRYPILDQSYQLLGLEAEDLFGGTFGEWHNLDTGKIENADYDRWVITELGRS